MKQSKAMFLKNVTLFLVLALCISNFSGNRAEAVSKPKKPSFTVTKRTGTTATIQIKKKGKVTGYQVYVKEGKTGKYRLWTRSFSRKFKIKKLKADSTYYVKIRAYRTKGSSTKKSNFSGAKMIKQYKNPTSTADPQTTQQPQQSGNYAEDVLALVNQERAKEGLPPLVLDEALNQAAMIRAGEIVEKFDHTRPDGTLCFTVLQQNGISYSAAGENISAGSPTAAAVMNGWMNSAGHRANIMSSDFGKLGVGFVKASSGYRYYWVQLFTN